MRNDLIHLRAFLHCGWSVLAPPDLTEEYRDNRGTLRLYDEHREVSISSSVFTPRDGRPTIADEILSRWPPDMLKGLIVSHERPEVGGEAGLTGVKGRGVQIYGASDHGDPDWVLMGLHVAESVSKLLQVTIVVDRPADRQWAIDVWRSTAYVGDDLSRMQEIYPEAVLIQPVRTGRSTLPS